MAEFANELPCLQTKRLVLRTFTVQDADDVARICQNENIYKNTLNLPWPYTKEDACNWILGQVQARQKGIYEFAVTRREDGVLAGSVGLFCNARHKNAEIGYWIGEAFWNRGYASEAVGEVIRFGLKEKGLHKIWGQHFAENPASGRVMEKNGMRQEGVLRDQYYKDGKTITVVRYGILADE